MGRKYRQDGYQKTSGDRDREKRRVKPQQPGRSREGPRSPRMPGFQEVMRCAMCGNIISKLTEITIESQCPKCQGDLRSCKHCHHFDTSARLECTQPIPTRITAKDVRTECEFFDPRTSIEKETSTPGRGTHTPKEARSAFDDLFR